MRPTAATRTAAAANGSARVTRSSSVLVVGSDGTLGRSVGGDTAAEGLTARGTITATGFPAASTAIRTQPSPAGLLSGSVRVALSCGGEMLWPGMTKPALVAVTASAQPIDATSAMGSPRSL
jgi:hypothetical protein